MFTVHGTLKSSSPFIGYHVQAFFQEQLDLVPAGAASTSTGTTGTTTASTATWVASVRTADVAPSGSFSLSLPDADKVKEPVTLEVLTPPGQVLTSKAYSLNDLKNAIEIPVEPQPTFTVTASTDLTLGQNLKLAGRVLDKSGQRQASNLEVVQVGSGVREGESVVLVGQAGLTRPPVPPPLKIAADIRRGAAVPAPSRGRGRT